MFLFTDLEGSTRSWDEHAEAMGAALALHDELCRGSVADRNGLVSPTGGDGFAVAFGRATDALAAAVAIQVALSGVVWRLLLRNCSKWQLNVGAALEVGPGTRDQILHREENPLSYFSVPRSNLILATMWAISGFTADDGGTRLVPGSHRCGADRSVEPDQVVRAEMPAGSELFRFVGTLHGAGANVTEDDWRYGVVPTYTFDRLRQEENQHVSMPLADAPALLDDVRSRLGLAVDYGDGGLGFSDPSVLLAPA